jgi:RNA-directed DNA polymerase
MRMLEPEGKLDTEAVAEVNGPTDEPLDWDAVGWRVVEDDVRRLRQRIFTASQAGDLIHAFCRRRDKLGGGEGPVNQHA